VTAAPTCAHHSAAPGIAQCVGCGTVLCGACTTRIQGRNLCAACLAGELAPGPAGSATSFAFDASIYLAPVLGLAVLLLLLAGAGLALRSLG